MSRRVVSDAASGGDPFLIGAADGLDPFEVGVVVEDDESGRPGGCRDDEVRDGQTMLSALGQLVLEIDGEVEHLWRDRGAVETSTFEEHRLVVRKPSAGEKHFKVDNAAGGDEAVLEERPETCPHDRIRKAGESALVG